MDWQVYLAKARHNLRTAQNAFAQGDFDSCVSRAYFAVFHAEIAALLKLTEFRQNRWGHDHVQAEFNRRLIRSRKLFPASLRSIHHDLIGKACRRLYSSIRQRTDSRALSKESDRDACNYRQSIGGTMKTQVILVADAKSLDALARFLGALEKISPEPGHPPKAICGEDNVIYVEIGYKTEEETFLVADRMAEVGADITEETGVLVALAPFVVEEVRRT